MKAKPLKLLVGRYIPCPADEATHLKLRFPGPTGTLILPVICSGPREGTPNWTWNGDVDMPTLRPSVLTTGADFRCHSWINLGRVEFLADCSHEFASKTLDLLEVE